MAEQRFGGAWTEDKLSRLRKYLRAYMKIFSRNPRAAYFRAVYVDAFAGTGFRKDPAAVDEATDTLFDDVASDTDADALRKGSVQVALELEVPAAVRFLPCEPLIGPLDALPLDDIDWVIVGGESGPGARPMRREWALSVLRQCRSRGVPFFFKQWGGARKKATGRVLDGRTYDELPRRRTAEPAQRASGLVEARV